MTVWAGEVVAVFRSRVDAVGVDADAAKGGTGFQPVRRSNCSELAPMVQLSHGLQTRATHYRLCHPLPAVRAPDISFDWDVGMFYTCVGSGLRNSVYFSHTFACRVVL